MERIGRYAVERAIARGGMGEVLLAKAEGPGGFAKTVVLKRILPELVQDPQFVRMFLDEAKLAALLNHPNIVQVYDFGEDRGVYYLAMEFIDGDSVRNAIRHFALRGAAFPPRTAAFLLSGVCEALHYAHGLRDEHGASYNIIHRDVTPENILVSSAGVPKIVDFGVAKAATNATKTQGGALKGKYAYMAPEQIRGGSADRRIDLYALGVTLYEMLAGRLPYALESEMRLLHDILTANVRPLREANPEVPEALAACVARAMAPEPADRFPDARAFQRALDEYLAASGSRPTSDELAQLVAEVRRERKSSEDATQWSGPKGVPGFPSLGAALRPDGALLDIAAEAVAATFVRQQVAGAPVESPAPAAPASPKGPSELGALRAPPEAAAPTVAVEDSPSRRPILVGASVAAAVVAFGTIGLLAARRGVMTDAVATAPTADPPARPAQAAPSTEVTIATPVALATPATAPAPSAIERPATARQGPASPQGPNEIGPSRAPAPEVVGGEGLLTLRSDPWCDVYVDGRKIGPTPLYRAPVPAGRRTIVLRNDAAGAQRTLSLDVPPGKEVKRAIVFPRGRLTVRVKPWAQVHVDGRAVGTTPLEPLELVAGQHEVRLVNPDLGKEETRLVSVRPGRDEVVKVVWR